MKKKQPMTAAQKLILLIVVLLAPFVLIQGCSSNPRQEAATTSLRNAPVETQSLSETVVPMGPQGALDAVYADVSVRGVEPADETVLFEKFGVSEDLYDEFYVNYSSGRYGLADVFILSPAPGEEEALREALEQVKLNRTMEFKNYDIYDALEHAENGQIFESGDYLVLVMMDNAENARTLIEAHLAE